MENKEVYKRTNLPSHNLEAELKENTEVFKLLDSVCKHYHKKLITNRLALDYLDSKNITGEKIRYEFRLGFADGSLTALLSAEQKKLLKDKGLIKPKGSELFSGCITAPITDEHNRIVNIMGFKVSGTDTKCIHLNETEAGIFNRKACKLGSREIILVSNITDALCLIAKGFYNTQSFESKLTDEHLKYLTDNRINNVILFACGRKKADKVKDPLLKEGVNVNYVNAESLDLASLTKEQIQISTRNAEVFKADRKESSFNVRCEDNTYWFNRCDITYRLSGVKNIFVSTLRVNVKTTCRDLSYYDTIDLYSSRAREGYANKLSRAIDVEPKLIEADLTKILEYLEEVRDKRLEKTDTAGKKTHLTDDEKKTGIKFLSSSDIFKQIDADMTALGYVSESENKLIVYLAAVSRFLPNPLNVYIQADSAGGKSALLNTLEKMLPPEDVWKAFTISTQALHYVEEDKFLDKVFMMGESIHDDSIEGLVRQMQSEGEISRLVTVKDDKTGEMRARLIYKKVSMSFMVTSTALFMNPENASRCLMIYADESAEQTMRIHRKLGICHDFKGKIVAKTKEEEIRRKHISAQKLLEKVNVFNPLWKHIKFPHKRPAMRRIFDQYLTLIDSVCFLRQYQKKKVTHTNPLNGEVIEGIECDIEDYKTAYRLFTSAILKRGGYDIPNGSRHLYENIRTMVRKLAKVKKVKPQEVSFMAKQVREHTQLGAPFIKKHMRILVDFEYIELIGGKRLGVRYLYKILADSPIEELDVSMIPTPEELKENL